ncbi:MAG: ATP-dependent helicase [bacterium]|nr:ATP-dependent helicase [bacterium]
MRDLRFELTAEQAKIVDCDATAISVVASAGTGKTEVVARRIERLLQDRSNASPVLALTYTVKAADELRDRIRARLGDLDRYVEAETIHRFAHSLLLQFGTYIGLPPDIEVLTKLEDRAELLVRWLDGRICSVPDDITATFNALDVGRARLKTPPLLKEWDAALSSIGAVDYPSMLTSAIDLLELSPIRRTTAERYGHVIVDEAQNLTPAQYRLLTLLIGGPNLKGKQLSATLVGDAKQSVVGFAGGDHTLMERFCEQYEAERFELKENFRSAKNIAAFGASVATRLDSSQESRTPGIHYAAAGRVERYEAPGEGEEGRYVATWIKGLLDGGIPEDALAVGEAGHVRPEDVAVLARSSSALLQTQSALDDLGIESATAASPEDWLSTRLGRLVLATIDLRANPHHRSARWHAARILEVDEENVASLSELAKLLERHPVRQGLAPLYEMNTPEGLVDTLQQVSLPDKDDPERYAAWNTDVCLIEETWNSFVERTRPDGRTWPAFSQHLMWVQRGRLMDPGVRLLTVHKAQGREFRAVALIGLNKGQFPDFRAVSREQARAELRTFYVAVTRPSRMLLLTRAQTRHGRYGPFYPNPSPFVDWN